MARKMKNSGVEWIGDIPEDWEVIQMRYLLSIKTGDKDTIDADPEGIYPFFVRSEVPRKITSYSYDGEGILTAGDGDIGEIFHYIKGKFDFHQRVYLFFNFKGIEIKYLYMYLQGNLKKHISFFSAKTTVDSLRLPWLKGFPVTFPPIQEQKSIASFLDQKTSQIDQLIEKTKESIEKYKTYKQSLVTETVTKGLDPNAKMKNSGIEWIGEIPEHWEVMRLKNIFRIKKVIAGEEGFNILSVTQSGLKIKDIINNEGQIAENYSNYQKVLPGDFVMNHMDLLTGWVDLSRYSGVTSPDYRVFRTKKANEISNYYYKYIFQACYTNKIFYGLGQGVSNLGRWRLQTRQFENFTLPLPSIKEQKEIASYLDNKTKEIDKVITTKEKLIEKLETYKKSLIFEYVTGKKEVV